mgnify:CR=1 FL=1
MSVQRTIGDRRPGDLVRVGEAEEAGRPFVVLRDGAGEQVIRVLPADGALLVGRGEGAEMVIAWDTRVSRVHARLERVGGEWSVVDDGLSRNGTFLNGARVEGRRRLRDGDVVVVGDTPLLFRDPLAAAREAATEIGTAPPIAADVTPAQRRVLVALCRPLKSGHAFARPATNAEIAADLVLSIEAVKTHMRTLFNAFGLADAPQAEKRLRLAESALALGLVSEREL